MLVKTPEELNSISPQKQVANIFFKKMIRGLSAKQVDDAIHELSSKIEQEIDCTQCANCCKKLEPGIEEKDIEQLAAIKQMSAADFNREFVAYDGQSLYLKTKPCKFLHQNKCSVYEIRPGACAAYPHMNQPDLKYKRSIWENYHICPIVYNVIEGLKVRFGFSYEN